jgi:hypothetical protein
MTIKVSEYLENPRIRQDAVWAWKNAEAALLRFSGKNKISFFINQGASIVAVPDEDQDEFRRLAIIVCNRQIEKSKSRLVDLGFIIDSPALTQQDIDDIKYEEPEKPF